MATKLPLFLKTWHSHVHLQSLQTAGSGFPVMYIIEYQKNTPAKKHDMATTSLGR